MPRTLNLAVHTVRRDAFIDAAQGLITARGYEQMSVQDLLDQLGASRGAFYHYFDSKEALLEAVIDRMVDAGLEAVAPILDDPSLAAVEKLQGLFSGIQRFKTDRKALLHEILKVWTSDDNAIVVEKLRRTTVPRLVPLLTRIVEQGVSEGVFESKRPADTARLVVILLQGLQDWATELFIARQAGAIPLEEVARTIANFSEGLERVLGVKAGSITPIDDATLHEWFG